MKLKERFGMWMMAHLVKIMLMTVGLSILFIGMGLGYVIASFF